MNGRFLKIMLAGLLLAVVTRSSALACATCYGASDSPLAQGMNWGILTLLGFIGAVLFGIVAFFVHVGRNAARLERASESQSQ